MEGGGMKTILAGLALVSGIGGGAIFLEDRYAKDAELVAAQNTNHQYLLELRIEQAERRLQVLNDTKLDRGLTPREQQRYQQLEKEIMRLYRMKGPR